ncbi:hypothetical protein CVN76_06285, partial [Bacillus sp. mrc49]
TPPEIQFPSIYDDLKMAWLDGTCLQSGAVRFKKHCRYYPLNVTFRSDQDYQRMTSFLVQAIQIVKKGSGMRPPKPCLYTEHASYETRRACQPSTQ